MEIVERLWAWMVTYMRKPEKPESLSIYGELLTRIVRDSAKSCGLRVSSAERDIVTIQQRLAIEGLGFLTKALPMLGKCLDKALASDEVMPVSHSFGMAKGKKHPKFLGAFFDLIFDSEGKVISPVSALETQQIQAVRAVRQICYLFYKLDGSCSKDLDDKVIEEFIFTDRNLPESSDVIPLDSKTEHILDYAKFLIFRVLKGFDPLEIRPKHGPGSVATGEKNWEKMRFSRFFPKLDEIYSYPEYFFYNYTHLCDELDRLESMETCDKATAKVCLVPKDSRGPRLISMEPLELQWIQQGLLHEFVRVIEHPMSPTYGYVNFTCQEVNRALALDNSFMGELITLDMKEASDRVSVWLVKKLFPTHVFNCLMACRSEATLLPDGRCINLKKFAPMGSAVCFPVEALIFWALAVSAVQMRAHGLIWRSNYDIEAKVYVYGDDIVIHKDFYEDVASVFEKCFLALNKDKCCTGSYFRESCGLDAFKLHAVSPIRIKAQWPPSSSSSASLSYVEYVNTLRTSGYVSAADFLQRCIGRCLGAIPVSSSPYRIPYTYYRPDWNEKQIEVFNTTFFRRRFNHHLHRTELRILQPVPLLIQRGCPDWDELFRLRSNARGLSPLAHLEPDHYSAPCRHTVPHRIKMRWRWVGLNTLLS